MSCLDMSWEEIQEAAREQAVRDANKAAVVSQEPVAVEADRKAA